MADTPETTPDRERVAFGQAVDWATDARFGTVYFGPADERPFPPLAPERARDLVAIGALDLAYRHNGAPPARELVEWAEELATDVAAVDVGLVGYMTGPARFDTRVAITGVSLEADTSLPGDLQGRVARDFDADFYAVDDCAVAFRWE